MRAAAEGEVIAVAPAEVELVGSLEALGGAVRGTEQVLVSTDSVVGKIKRLLRGRLPPGMAARV